MEKTENITNEKKDTDPNAMPSYDDVYRTMLNDCSSLIIPVINEVFHENYTGKEKIVYSQNEHFINRQDGDLEKRVTDASFTIIGIEAKNYLVECQSNPDSSMLVRIFEYSTQIALDEGEIEGDELKVEIPNCAILFLRSTKNTPDKLRITLNTPGGSAGFDVLIMKTQEYTLDEIFEKNLYFLIPFYIFSYEAHLAEYDEDEQKLQLLKAEYARINDRLDDLCRKQYLSTYYRKIIVEMTHTVLKKLAAKYENIRKGVQSVMGGKVLEYESKTIYQEGLQKGRQEGRQEGEIEAKKRLSRKLFAAHTNVLTIADLVDATVSEVEDWVQPEAT
ncbi:MAG: hypothetical protein LUG93_14830 [Lachnospiraceae bacterium]|nr:hypothetical protein [Lachnospiraceae bacterium]